MGPLFSFMTSFLKIIIYIPYFQTSFYFPLRLVRYTLTLAWVISFYLLKICHHFCLWLCKVSTRKLCNLHRIGRTTNVALQHGWEQECVDMITFEWVIPPGNDIAFIEVSWCDISWLLTQQTVILHNADNQNVGQIRMHVRKLLLAS